MNAAAQILQVEQIPVDQIRPSATNPRKHYDQAALEELAASIKSVGVQVPLSLRPAKAVFEDISAYEIVGGERRWRAAQIAGLTAVPAIAREMSDAECREAQLIDNLQRADLSPMEEAEGYELLIREAGAEGFAITDEQLAAKVGKALGHVRGRRKLLELIPEARAGLAENFITFGCALLIAKLQPADQDKATIRALDMPGFETASDSLKAAREQREEDRNFREEAETKGTKLEPWEEEDEFEPMQERDLRGWIEDNVTLDLAKASWPLDKQIEGVDAPACQACPKRSGSDAALFAELTAKQDVCTDRECFAAKRKAFVQIAVSQAKDRGAALLKLSTKTGYGAIKPEQKQFRKGQWIEAEPGSCPRAQSGITEECQVLSVCVDAKCKTHKHSLIAGGDAARAPKTDWEAERKKREEKERAYVEAERPIRLIVYSEIRKKLTGAKLVRLVIANLLDRAAGDVASLCGIRVEKGVGWEVICKRVSEAVAKAKDAELDGWLADVLVARSVMPSGHWCDDRKRDREELWKLGKFVGVDCDAIAKKATAPVAKTKPAPAKKAVGPVSKVMPAPAKKKAAKKLSPEGRKRIADAMRKRWAKAQKAGAR
jgi:ParB family chromosome partitioning protein